MVTGAPTVPQLRAELEGRWRAFTTADDQRRADYLLGDVWREISRIPTLLERLDVDEDLAADARMIACEAVKRAMVAEGRLGVEEEERTDGAFQRRRRYSAASSSATAELTDDERAKLSVTTAAEGASVPRWTGDSVAPTYVLPRWPRGATDPVRRPW